MSKQANDNDGNVIDVTKLIKKIRKDECTHSTDANMHEEIYICACGSDIFILYVDGKIECAMCNIFIIEDNQLDTT